MIKFGCKIAVLELNQPMQSGEGGVGETVETEPYINITVKAPSS